MLEINHRIPLPAVALITVKGRMMLGESCQPFESLVTGMLAGGCRHLVFDLSGVTQIDSTGIGRFIAAYRQAMALQGSIKMAAASNAVRSAFHVTRLDTVFPFFSSVDEALPPADSNRV